MKVIFKLYSILIALIINIMKETLNNPLKISPTIRLEIINYHKKSDKSDFFL